MLSETIKQDFEDELWDIIEYHNNHNAHTFKRHLFNLVVKETLKFPDFFEMLSYLEPYEYHHSDFYQKLAYYITECSRLYNHYRQLFKNAFHSSGRSHFEPLQCDNLEQLHDNIQMIVYTNQVKKFAHRFVRSYKYLLNEQSYELFSIIMESDFTREQIQQHLRKIATFKTSDELNKTLTKLIKHQHSPDYIIKQINASQTDVAIKHNDNNLIIIEVNDFEAIHEFGSTQWCIANNKSEFYDYLYSAPFYINAPFEQLLRKHNDFKGHQFIAYDCLKDISDPNHIIGFTVASNGTILAAHNKNDDDVKEAFKNGDLIDLYIIDQLISEQAINPDNVKQILYPNSNEVDVLKNPYRLIANIKNPLHVFMQICRDHANTNSSSIIDKATDFIIVPNDILIKSIDDYFRFQHISTEQMFQDLLDFHLFLEEAEKLKQQMERIQEYKNNINESSIEVEINIQPHLLFSYMHEDARLHHYFSDVLNNPPICHKLFVQHCDKIIHCIEYDIHRMNGTQSKKYSDELGLIEKTLISESPSFVGLGASVLDLFTPCIINDGIDNISDLTQNTLALRYCLNASDSQENVEELLTRSIQDNAINVNKITSQPHCFTDTLIDNIKSFIHYQ